MKRRIAALTASAAFFVGGCGGTEAVPNRPVLEQSFSATLDYWGKQGLIIDIGDTMLKTVVDGSVACGDAEVVNVTSNSVSPATYCSAIKTIVIADTRYGKYESAAAAKNISAEAAATAAIGHELAHGVLSRNGAIFPNQKQEELAADCLSGVAAGAIAGESNRQIGEQAAAVLGELGHADGGDHGTGQERITAFFAGFNNGIAGCGTVATQLSISLPVQS